MQILNTYTVTSLSVYITILFVLIMLGLIFAAFGALTKENSVVFWATMLLLIGGLYWLIGFGMLNLPIEISKTRYECAVTDIEVFDRYTIIEHRGDIWVLEELENVDTRTNS